MLHLRCLIACASLLASSFALAQQQTRPATTPAATAPAALTATITAVEGLVQVRDDEESPWQPAAAGMVLSEGAEFRTGPRSAVQFEIPPGQTITLDRLGTVKLVEAVRSGGAVKTDLGMRYGRLRYDIEAAGVSHDATIHSPSSTLAVRGTQVSLYDQPPFVPEAVSLTGRAQFRNLRRQIVAFGGRRRAAVRAQDTTPAQAALVDATLKDPELARDDQRLRELRFLFAQQGELFGNVAASNRPVTDAQLPQLLGGRLDFVLRWSDPDYADLNLVINTPRDETFGNPPFLLSLFPNDPATRAFLDRELPQSVPSGGRVGLNHIGPEGIEIASWDRPFPRGTYTVAAYNFLYLQDQFDTTGLPKVPFRIEAFLDGVRQPILLNFEEAFAGKEPCRFGLVFRDEIAIGELVGTGLQIAAPYPENCAPDKSLLRKPQAVLQKQLKPARSARPAIARRSTRQKQLTPPPSQRTRPRQRK